MRKLTLLLLICLTIFQFNCSFDDQFGFVNVRFKLMYNGQPLEMFKDYEYPSGQKIFFNRFSFFIADVSLQNAEGQYIKVKDIDYLDLTNSHTGSSTDGLLYPLTEDGIAPGNYKNLKISLGVPKESNDKNPSQFSQKPLSDQAEYWIDWKSYIFTRTEGQIDFDKDGKFDESFSLHTGANEAFRTIELPINIELSQGLEKELTINIDLYKQFLNDGSIYDIVSTPQIHSKSQTSQVKQLIDNLSKAVSIK